MHRKIKVRENIDQSSTSG